MHKERITTNISMFFITISKQCHFKMHPFLQDLICVTDYTSGYLMTFNKLTGADYGLTLTKTNGDFYRAIAMYSSETQPQKSGIEYKYQLKHWRTKMLSLK